MRIQKILVPLIATSLFAACEAPPEDTFAADPRVVAIHEQYVFADMHAHPSRFHRRNIEGIETEEIERYRRSTMDIVVANISSDMAFEGRYTNRDGTEVPDGKYKPAPGEVYALSADRLARLQTNFERGDAVHADTPASVIEARRQGQVAVLPALEGGDALEGDIAKLEAMYDNGLRLIQPIPEAGLITQF